MQRLILAVILVTSLAFPALAYAGGLRVPENIRLEKVECRSPYMAYAFFTWDKVEFATSYRFYSRVADETNYSRDRSYVVAENKAQFSYNPNFGFYLAVSSQNTFQDTGKEEETIESDKSKEYFLAKSSNPCAQTPGEVQKSITPSPATIIIQDSGNNEKVEDLEKQVQKLENNLKRTQEKQSRQEGILNKIINFLKNFFRFEP